MSQPDRRLSWFPELDYLIEYVPQNGDTEETKIATVTRLNMAYEVLELAKRSYPGRVLIMRQRARIIARHEPDLI
ncbi:hypothetical protein [Jiella marina]|uniref:hypothetical protein n=1 Tax=Jiella sp. LLJ827 TaxID=2917712 RepID=UPI002100D3B9|nr:hypothetical protein [Jiella sp. LLJ827]MCQ0990593.1 hypothetical protein [Jiella sp. LLJ827]